LHIRNPLPRQKQGAVLRMASVPHPSRIRPDGANGRKTRR
jgi:hypothetical protein